MPWKWLRRCRAGTNGTDKKIRLRSLNENYGHTDFVRTDHTNEQIRQLIINNFANSGLPLIKVLDGNYNDDGSFLLRHYHDGRPLNKEYANKTLKHIYDLWNRPTHLLTKVNDADVMITTQTSGSNIPVPTRQKLRDNYGIDTLFQIN